MLKSKGEMFPSIMKKLFLMPKNQKPRKKQTSPPPKKDQKTNKTKNTNCFKSKNWNLIELGLSTRQHCQQWISKSLLHIRKKTEVDCIFNFDSAFCTWKKPYLMHLNTLSAEIIINIMKAVCWSKITERLYIYFL